jgi:4-amino-4-deoxy-L-arabinose transferase-like glycosyltransferase
MGDKAVKGIRSNRFGLGSIFIVGILGAFVILWQTRYGPGTTGDSVHYLMGAQNLLDGNGFSRFSGGGEIRPITMFPPFYSVVLAGLKLIGLDPYLGVRLLHAILFGASILLVAFLILRYTRSYWASLFGALLILVAKEMVFYYSWVLTEALFIFLLLLFIYALAQYLDSKRTWLLVFASLLVGMATLTRYVGLSMTMVGLASILILNDIRWRRRIMDSLIFGGISVVPLVLWLMRNATLSGTAVNRAFMYHPMSSDLIQAYRAEVSFWFVPSQLGFPHWLRKGLMLLLGIPAPAVFFFLDLKENIIHRRKPRDTFWTLPWIMVFFIFSYVGLLFLNLTLLDAISDFNTVPRYLIPIYVSAIILFVIAFYRILKRWEKWKTLRVFVLAIGVILMVLYALKTLAILQDPLSNIGYTGLKQQRPETMAMLESIEGSAPIVSNDPEMVYIFTGRPAYLLPLKVDFHTTLEREDYDQQVEATRKKLNQGGVIVIFGSITEREQEVLELLEAELLDGFYGSAFYGYPEAIAE